MTPWPKDFVVKRLVYEIDRNDDVSFSRLDAYGNIVGFSINSCEKDPEGKCTYYLDVFYWIDGMRYMEPRKLTDSKTTNIFNDYPKVSKDGMTWVFYEYENEVYPVVVNLKMYTFADGTFKDLTDFKESSFLGVRYFLDGHMCLAENGPEVVVWDAYGPVLTEANYSFSSKAIGGHTYYGVTSFEYPYITISDDGMGGHYLINLQTGEDVKLGDSAIGKTIYRNGFVAMSHIGDFGKSTSIYVQKLATGETKTVINREYGVSNWDFSEDGRFITFIRYDEGYLYDLASDKLYKIPTSSEGFERSIVTYIKATRTALFWLEDDSVHQRLYHVSTRYFLPSQAGQASWLQDRFMNCAVFEPATGTLTIPLIEFNGQYITADLGLEGHDPVSFGVKFVQAIDGSQGDISTQNAAKIRDGAQGFFVDIPCVTVDYEQGFKVSLFLMSYDPVRFSIFSIE